MHLRSLLVFFSQRRWLAGFIFLDAIGPKFRDISIMDHLKNGSIQVHIDAVVASMNILKLIFGKRASCLSLALGGGTPSSNCIS